MDAFLNVTLHNLPVTSSLLGTAMILRLQKGVQTHWRMASWQVGGCSLPGFGSGNAFFGKSGTLDLAGPSGPRSWPQDLRRSRWKRPLEIMDIFPE